MKQPSIVTLRLLLVAATAAAATACGGGVDAGENGGIAFVLLAVFLLIGCAVLYFALGRGE